MYRIQSQFITSISFYFIESYKVSQLKMETVMIFIFLFLHHFYHPFSCDLIEKCREFVFF